MGENTTELTRNFAPTLPKESNQSLSQPTEKKSMFSAFKKEEALPEKEVQEQTKKLFDLLVDRVELRVDIARQSENAGLPQGKGGQEMSLQDRLALIKQGGVHGVVSEISSQKVKNRALEHDLKKLRETEEKISELTKNTQVVAEYSKFREVRVEKLRDAREVSEGQSAIKQLNLQQEKMARQVFLASRQYSPGERQIIDENKQIIQAIENRVSELKKNPEVFDLSRLRQLEGYQQGLKEDRFAETPSREKYIDQVRQYWSQGKKVLLTGSTGGGKTELLLHASRSLFGQEAERLTGHELMTNYEVYGKTKGGVVDGQMTLMFGAAPFIRALDRNVPFVFDEINVVPNKILMRLKTDLNSRVGSKVTIQEDSDKVIQVGDNFAVGATENVKSEKHIDREKLDPALVRMFEPLAIDYFPPHELYDIMLSSMMDVRGGVKLSVKDANDTLRQLCNATEWIQKAYLGQPINTGSGVLEARGQASLGKPATLREAVLDPGKALDMLVGWEDAEKSGLTFKEFLNKRIVAFVNNENFPEEDRYYLAEIFALQGFLRGVKATDLRVAGLDQGTLDAWSGHDGKRYVPKNNYTSPEIVAKLDPYGTLKRPVTVEANDLLDEETMEEIKEEELTDLTPTFSNTKNNLSTSKSSAASSSAMAGLSPEGRFKIEAIDAQYDPKSLPSDKDDRYKRYPELLILIATKDQSTVGVIAQRLANILENNMRKDGGESLYYYVNALTEFVSMDATRKDKNAMLEVSKILNNVNKLNWKNEIWKDNIRQRLEKINSLMF